MSLFRFWSQRWNRLREVARQEFLREPYIILFEHGSEKASVAVRETAHGR